MAGSQSARKALVAGLQLLLFVSAQLVLQRLRLLDAHRRRLDPDGRLAGDGFGADGVGATGAAGGIVGRRGSLGRCGGCCSAATLTGGSRGSGCLFGAGVQAEQKQGKRGEVFRRHDESPDDVAKD